MAFKPPTFGTAIIDPTAEWNKQQEEEQKKRDKQDRIDCIRKGGKWDEKTKTCSLPFFEKQKNPYEIKLPKQPETTKEPLKVKTPISQSGTARPGTTPAFRTTIQGDRFDINLPISSKDFSSKESYEQAKRIKTGGGAGGFMDTGEIGRKQSIIEAEEEQARLQQSIAQIGQIGQLTPAEQAPINWSQAATAGGAKVIPGLIGGAATGAVAGSVVPGIGTAVGAIGGAVAGAVGTFTSGILSNIKEQQRGELQAADVELKDARTNMRQLAMLASQDPTNADVYIQQYNDQLTRVYQARRQTQAEVQGDLNSWMEDGREQLADFDAFLQPGGIADIYGQKLKIALQTDTPLSFEGTELMNLE